MDFRFFFAWWVKFFENPSQCFKRIHRDLKRDHLGAKTNLIHFSMYICMLLLLICSVCLFVFPELGAWNWGCHKTCIEFSIGLVNCTIAATVHKEVWVFSIKLSEKVIINNDFWHLVTCSVRIHRAYTKFSYANRNKFYVYWVVKGKEILCYWRQSLVILSKPTFVSFPEVYKMFSWRNLEI